jgi:drug/metabolite transporter (DMT)-like permease
LYINSTLVMLLGWAVYKKPMQPIRVLAMAISYSGVLLVFSHELSLTAADVPVDVFWLGVLNAVACTVAPVLMVMMAVERIGAALTAQTGMIGPMSTIALGVLLLDERCDYCF